MHSVLCLTTGTKPRPKRVHHRVRSSASSLNFRHPLFTLRSSSSCFRLFPRLPVTSILPSMFPSITCFRRQVLRKMWPIQLNFLLCIVYMIFISSLTLCNTSYLTWSGQPISILLQHHISKLTKCFISSVRSVPVSAPYKATLQI